jgi:rod shape-determining protein MreC
MRRWHWIVLVALALAAAGLVALPPAATEPAKAGTQRLAEPLYARLRFVHNLFGAAQAGVKRLDQLEQENKNLLAELEQLKAENSAFRDLERENDRLRRALEFQKASSFRLRAARVIAREPSSWWQIVTIDRGEQDGVRVNQPVITTRGLVGKIIALTQGTAKVVLLGDATCSISASLEGGNESGIVTGQPTEAGEVQLRMSFIPRSAPVTIGQKAYTSGLGGVFPFGLLVGTVTGFVAEAETGGFGLYRELILKPAAELSNITDVFVVIEVR